MNRKMTILMLAIVISNLFLFSGCSKDNSVQPQASDTAPTTIDGQHYTAVGQGHTAFLEELNRRRSAKASMTDEQLIDLCMDVVNEQLTSYGKPLMTREEVENYFNQGIELVQMDPDQIMRSHFGTDVSGYKWFRRWANDATYKNAKSVYVRHCELYGAPEHGSLLEQTVDVAMSSADIWGPYRERHPQIRQNIHVTPREKSLKGWLKAAVCVTADAAVGGAVGYGVWQVTGGAGGVWAFRAAGAAGGLASTGASAWLFGS